jgi:hypothetical protein
LSDVMRIERDRQRFEIAVSKFLAGCNYSGQE